MRISIIIPTFNSAAVITSSLRSINEQVWRNFEIIVVDGGSTDGTLTILQSFQKELKTQLVFISELDKGIYDAMNKGIRIAQGEWLYFMGADDFLYDNYVLKNLAESGLLENFDLVYGDVYNSYQKMRLYGQLTHKELVETGICQQSIFYRRSLFERYGYFNIRYKVYAHIERDKFFLCYPEVRCTYIDMVIANYAGNGYSLTNYDDAYWANIREILFSNFSIHLPKKEIYPGVLPFLRYTRSWKSFILSLEATVNTFQMVYLVTFLKNYSRVWVLRYKKLKSIIAGA